jgi:molybdopterin synthase sulfurtransferase
MGGFIRSPAEASASATHGTGPAARICLSRIHAVRGVLGESNGPTVGEERMTSLVSARWLSEELSNGFGVEPDQLVLEVGCGRPDREEHIPHSIWLDTNDIETGAHCWRLVDDAALLCRLAQHGIARSTSVVIAGEPLPAARIAWTLAYAGVRSVRILDGGLRSWIAGGGPLSRGWRAPQTVVFGGGKFTSEVRSTREEVSEAIALNRYVLADVRSRAEHDGTTSGYSYIQARGHIPGSVFARGGPNAEHLEDYTRADGTFADLESVEAMWRELGISKRACFYCGTGWRASVAFLFARWLAFEHASIYDGGWFDWTANSLLARSCG